MTRMGRYELGEVLGQGGGGHVRRAVLTGPANLRLPVALKVLHSGGEGLRREARLGGLLRHRNLVDVYEIGEADGTWFCAMELCDDALSNHLPLSPRAVVEVGLAVCDALQYAGDALGLVHLDIKPTNLLLAGGQVKLADLGISRATGFELDGRIRGTPGYMAPEQIRGGQVDVRTDLYALGVTLIELATGTLPVATDTKDPTSLGLTETAASTVSLDDLEPDVEVDAVVGLPDWLAPAVRRCLEVDPADRWPNVAALANALGQLDVEGDDLQKCIGWSPPPVRTRRGLPPTSGTLIGREALVERLRESLSEAGWIALKGTAGIGKSRLALEVARTWGLPGAVWRCDLAAAEHTDALLMAIGRAVDLSLGPEPLRALGRTLAARGPCLLLLDDVDRVDGLDRVIPILVEAAPELRVMTTARRAEDACERVFEIGPLSAEASRALLFQLAHRRGVELGANPEVDALVERLDGLPLALELAAGRLGVLTVSDLVAQLGVSWLRTGREGRHGTLTAALDWSWAALDPVEQQAVVQLSVFRGGFTVAAAQAVLDVERSLEILEALVDHSWLYAGEHQRLQMMRTAQAHASQRAGPAVALAEERHCAWFSAMGDPAVLDAHMGGQDRFLTWTRDLDNFVVATRRALAAEHPHHAVGAVSAAYHVLQHTGPLSLAASLLAAVVAQVREGTGAARVANLHGDVLRVQGEMEASASEQVRALTLARAAGDARTEAFTLVSMGIAYWRRQQPELAREVYLQAGELARSEGLHSKRGQIEGNLANLESDLGNEAAAEDHYQRAIKLHQSTGNRRAEGITLSNLGILYADRGDLHRADQCYRRAIARLEAVGALIPLGAALCNLGNLCDKRNQPGQARLHLQRALQIHRDAGDPRSESLDHGNLGGLLCTLGERDAGWQHLLQAEDKAREAGDRAVQTWWRCKLGAQALAAADLSLARHWLEKAHELGDQAAWVIEERDRLAAAIATAAEG